MYEQTNYLMHHGILGMKWGIRRYQNYDGTLTEEGKQRYSKYADNENEHFVLGAYVASERKDKIRNTSQYRVAMESMRPASDKFHKQRSDLQKNLRNFDHECLRDSQVSRFLNNEISKRNFPTLGQYKDFYGEDFYTLRHISDSMLNMGYYGEVMNNYLLYNFYSGDKKAVNEIREFGKTYHELQNQAGNHADHFLGNYKNQKTLSGNLSTRDSFSRLLVDDIVRSLK